MLDLRSYHDSAWPDELKPHGEAFDREPFEDWYARNLPHVSHLHPKLAEQWVYKHWGHTRFDFIPLDSLRWELQVWKGDDVLRDVRREFGGELHPDFDYDVFNRDYVGHRHPTAAALDQGTWDYPIVVLSTPAGLLSLDGDFPSVRYVLVEGHQRQRYLNALHAKGLAPAGPHEVFVLNSDITG